MIFYLIAAIFAALLESTIFPYPLTLFVIGVVTIGRQEKAAFLAFATGVLLDLFSLRPVGLSSLYFLALIYLGDRYRKKIYGATFVYRFLFLIVPFAAYTFLFYKNLNIVSLLVTIFLVLIGLLILERFFPISGNEKRLQL